MVGGGPVYLDRDQLFFQICLPARARPAGPLPGAAHAARAGRDGLSCRRRARRSSTTSSRSASATARSADTAPARSRTPWCVCGNLIERFDHERATRVLALADPAQRDQTLALMRRFVAATPVDPAAFRAALVDAYAARLGLAPVPGGLSETERTGARRTSTRSLPARAGWPDPAGPLRPAAGPSVPARSRCAPGYGLSARRTKAPAWRPPWWGARSSRCSSQDQRPERVVPPGRSRPSRGCPFDSVGEVLAGFGEPGRRLAAAFDRPRSGRL